LSREQSPGFSTIVPVSLGPMARPASVELEATGALPYLEGSWSTPGLYLAQRVAGLDDVEWIGEKIESKFHLIFVLLREYREDALDSIFGVEQEMYRIFRRLPFDLRTARAESPLRRDSLEREWIVHFSRRSA